MDGSLNISCEPFARHATAKQMIWSLIMRTSGTAVRVSLPPERQNLAGWALAATVSLVIIFGSSCHRTEKPLTAPQFKDQYFARCLTYDMVGDRLLVTDNKSPRIITLDPWLEVVYAAADGQRTSSEFITKLKQQYPGGAPAGLEEQTWQFLAKMEAEGLIRFSGQKVQLPYYLTIPSSQQDKQKALAEMKKDGFIK